MPSDWRTCVTGSDWSNQRRTSQNGTDEYKTTESQSQGVIAPKFVFEI